MSPELIILAIVFVPVVVLALFRANGAIVFFSLALGNLLVQFVGKDATTLSNMFSARANLSQYIVSVALLALPAVFTTFFMIRTIQGKARRLLNIVPALAVGLVGLLLLVPLVSPGLRGSITQTSLWHTIDQLQEMIVVLSTIVSVFSLWLLRSKRLSGEKHGKHHDG